MIKKATIKVIRTIRLNKKRLLPFFVGAFVILVPIVYLTLRNINSAQAAWFDEEWAYRKKIIITKTVASQNNVYIAFNDADVLDTSATGSFQEDCADIRFVKENGDILPYYINSGCGTSSTDIDVLFDSIVLGNNTIYMYYGNPSAEIGFENTGFSTEATNYSIGTPSAQENGPGPMGYWKFDEGYGTTAYDSTSGNNDATISGASWKNSDYCYSNNCLSFDGVNDIATIDASGTSGTVSRTGSVAAISSSANASSQSITVPADAELAVVSLSGWDSTGSSYFSGGAVTLGGDSMTLGKADGGSDANNAAIFYLSNPSTGSQTLAWDWAGSSGADEGVSIIYTFYSNVDTADPIRDSGGQSTTGGAGTASTGTLTALEGDLVVAVGAGNGSSASWTNATEVYDTLYNSNVGTLAEVSPSGDVSVSVTVGSYASVSAIVIKPGAASGTEPIDLDNGGFTTSGWFRAIPSAAPTYSANTIINFGGFEHGDETPSDNTGGTDVYRWDTDHAGALARVSMQQTTKRTGDYAMYYDATSNSFQNEWFEIRHPNRTAVSEGVVWVTFYFYPDVQVDSVNPDILALGGDCSNVLEWGGSSWNMYLTAATDSATVALTPGEWNKVEVMIDCPNETSTLSINDSATVSNNVFGGGSVSDVINTIALGVSSSGMYGGSAYYDDWVVSTAELDFDPAVHALNVDGEGNSTDWDATSGYQEIDEVPEDGDTTYITSSTATNKQLATLESVSAAGISGSTQAIKTQILARDEGGASNLATVVRTGGTDYDQGEDADPGAAYYSIGTVLQTNPNTSSTWTANDLDNLEIGVLNNASVASRVTSAMAMVLTDGTTLNQYLISHYDDDQGYKVWLDENDYLNFGIDDDSSWNPDDVVTSTMTLADNKWHHFSAVKNSTSNIKLYVDGVENASDASLSATGNLTSGSATITIGADAPTNSGYFKGFLDNFKIYQYPRTSDQIKTDSIKGASASGSSASFGHEDKTYLSDGLVGYWKMDETSWDGTESEIVDYSGNGNHGTGANAVTTAAGKFGLAGDFDGTSDELVVPDNNSLDLTNNWTIAGWIYDSEASLNHDWDYLVAKGAVYGGSDMPYAVGIGYNQLIVDSEVGGTPVDETISISSYVSAQEWFHFAVVMDDVQNTVNYFINGEHIGSDSFEIDAVGNSSSLYIGADSSGNQWYGKIDDLRVYNRILSPAEVQKLYNWAPGPIAYYSLDENTGTSNVYDKSGNEHTGSIAGTMTESDWVKGKFGSALNFDGSNDYVDFYSASFENNFSTAQGTLSVWAKVENSANWTDSTTRSIINVASDLDNRVGILKGSTDNSLTLQYEANNVLESETVTTSTEGWFHAAITWDTTADEVKFYFDGKHVNTSTTLGTWAGALASDRVVFGSHRLTSGNYWNGDIDEVKVYNYARTPSQVIEDMNGGHPIGGSPVGSQAIYYKFDEMQGTTANNSGNQGTSYNGNITSGTWTSEGKVNSALTFTAGTSVTDTITDPGYTNTLSLWVYPTTSAASKTLVTATKLTTDSSSRPVYGSCTGTALNLDTWSHLVAVSNGSGSCAIYQNGIQTATNTTGVTFGTSLNIGGSSFTGNIDEFKFYTAALTAEQIGIDMNANASADFGSTTKETDTLTDGAGNPPVLYMDFSENTGTSTVYDKSGNGNDGGMNGSMTESDWVRGPKGFGSALDIDGNDDYLLVTDDASLRMTDAMTISVWIYPRTLANYRYILEKGQNDDDNYALLLEDDGNVGFEFRDSGGTSRYLPSSGSVTANTWNFVALTYDSTDNIVTIHINDTIESATTTYNLGGTQTHDLYIGRQNFTTYTFDGMIDELKIYDYARTPAQIAYDHNRGAPIGWWKFDDCQGDTAKDSGGNSLDGTITITGTGTNQSLGTCSSDVATEAWNNGTTGKYNSSIYLDGGDEYIYVGDSPQLSFTNGSGSDLPVSFSYWIKNGNLGYHISKELVGGSGVYRIYAAGGANNRIINFHLGDNTGAYIRKSTVSEYPNATWTFITVTYDGSESLSGMNIYFNGILQETTSASGSTYAGLSDTTHPLVFGARLDGSNNVYNEINGYLDDVRIFNYELSNNQIKTIMNNGAANFAPSTGSP